jgi:Flp pilus assembly pilin Flp
LLFGQKSALWSLTLEFSFPPEVIKGDYSMSRTHSLLHFSSDVKPHFPTAGNPMPDKTESGLQFLKDLIPNGKTASEKQLYQEVLDCYHAAAKRILRTTWSNDQGQDIAEYAVMLAVILIIVVGTLRLIGTTSNNVFSAAASSIQ